MKTYTAYMKNFSSVLKNLHLKKIMILNITLNCSFYHIPHCDQMLYLDRNSLEQFFSYIYYSMS